MTARTKKENRKPISGRPKTTSTKTRVSGVFRTTSTYAVPAHRSGGAGATRIAASTVPTTSAITAENPVSRIVTQKPRRMTSNWSKRTLKLRARVQRRLGRRLAAALAQRVLVRLLPGAVAERPGQRVVQEGAERVVALLEAHAVPLLAERLADDLEVVGLLSRVPEQDRAVGGDRVHGLV